MPIEVRRFQSHWQHRLTYETKYVTEVACNYDCLAEAIEDLAAAFDKTNRPGPDWAPMVCDENYQGFIANPPR